VPSGRFGNVTFLPQCCVPFLRALRRIVGVGLVGWLFVGLLVSWLFVGWLVVS